MSARALAPPKYSSDASDFLSDYRKANRSDPRLAQYQYIVEEFNQSYEKDYMLLNTFYAEAYKDLSYYLGNQWSLEEQAYLNNQRRSSFTYNKIRRIIALLSGLQRKNRLASVVRPVEGSSEETAEILNDTLQHVMKSAKGYENISQAFKGALTTGITFLSPWIDYRDDPINGDIKIHLDEWNAVAWDPFMTKKTLEDCSHLSRRKFLSIPEVISLIPEKEDVIKRLPYGNRDDKFTYLPYARQWGQQKLMNYTEYWRAKWENQNVLVDMETGETRKWEGDRNRLRLYRQLFPQIEVIKKPVRSIDLGIIVEGELLNFSQDPGGLNDYPFVPFTAIWEPSYDLYSWNMQSIVRLVRDPQTELNKRRSAMIQSIDSQLNSGWIAKTNSVSNPTSLYKSGYGGQVIFLKPEAQMTDIQRIEPTGIHPSLFQLEQEFEKDMMETVAVNPEQFGMAENDKIETAGILAKSRLSAGLVSQQDLLDSLSESQEILSEKVLKLIQINYSAEKIQLITKKRPTDEIFSKMFSKYNIVVEEGMLTDTQQQNEFIQRTALRGMGINITDPEIIEASNLHDKKKIQERMQKESQAAQQAQQMQEQLLMQNQATVTRAVDSKANSDDALASERIAKIQLDQAVNAERISRSEEDRTAGVLNLIKAIKELQGMDTDTLAKRVEIIMSLEEAQRAKEESKATETRSMSQSSSQNTSESQQSAA